MSHVIHTAVVLLLTASLHQLARGEAPKNQAASPSSRWEYKSIERSKIVDLALEAKKAGREFDPEADGLTRGLNLLAEQGWDLIAIDPAHRFEGTTTSTGSDGSTSPVKWSSERPSEYIFRRAHSREARRPASEPGSVEFRLAEYEEADGLQKAVVAGTEDVVYLHDKPFITTPDIAGANLASDPNSEPAIELRLTETAGKRMAETTKNWIGKPMAVLLRGKVIVAQG